MSTETAVGPSPVIKPTVTSVGRSTFKFTARDLVMLTKPSIISLLLAITLVPMFLAGEQPPSLWLILSTMAGGFWRRRRQRAQPVRGSRHRSRDVAHEQAPAAERPHGSVAGAGLWADFERGQRGAALVRGQPAHGAAGAGGHSLLRTDLHAAAQAAQHAKYRRRRRSGRDSAAGRLGGSRQ